MQLGAQHFSDTDLFCFLNRFVWDHAEQAQARNADRNECKYQNLIAPCFFALVIAVKVLIQELPCKNIAGKQSLRILYEPDPLSPPGFVYSPGA